MENNNNFFVYSHTRPDTDQIFYIGMGKRKNKGNIYFRAYTKRSRNKYWKNIVNKNNGEFIVNILFECMTIEEVKVKEIELISLHGRKDLGLGNLCNMTIGGDGVNGYIWTEENKQRMRNRVIDEKTREKQRNRGKAIIELDVNGNFKAEWRSAEESARQKGLPTACNIYAMLRGEIKTVHKSIYVYKSKYDPNKDYSGSYSQSRRVLQFDAQNNLIKDWESAKVAAKVLKIGRTSINNNCFNRSKFVYINKSKFKFKFK